MAPKTRQQQDAQQQQQLPHQQLEGTPEEDRTRVEASPSDASPRRRPGRMEQLETAVADIRTSLAVLLRDRRQQIIRDDLATAGPSGITPAQRPPPDVPEPPAPLPQVVAIPQVPKEPLPTDEQFEQIIADIYASRAATTSQLKLRDWHEVDNLKLVAQFIEYFDDKTRASVWARLRALYIASVHGWHTAIAAQPAPGTAKYGFNIPVVARPAFKRDAPPRRQPSRAPQKKKAPPKKAQ